MLREYHQQGRLLDSGTREQAETSAARAWLADTLAGQHSMLLVDTNQQAARLSAELRAELVRLGRVDENGVPLGMQGTFAGVGDLVQARWNGWDLAGVEGNRRGPINRETYRVTATRADGGLEVAPITGPDTDGERIVLPAGYVAEHLVLGYASTVHAAQGVTVDTTHTVITPRTGPAALYVGMSRGRESNTAHVTTITGVDDPAQGRAEHNLHRDPVAALAVVLDPNDQAGPRSAVATATESAAEAGSIRTATELLADAAQLAATERTAIWLDQLTDTGVISAQQRTRIAAEDGAASLTRVLRRAELAGHDPKQVLHDALADRPLDGARNTTNVIYSRITEGRRFDPVGEAWSSWIPQTDNREWSTYLDALAAEADRRAAELGSATADERPAWAVEALGPVPTEPSPARDEWEQQAGLVASYRELRGHNDDAEALGPAPKPGQVEAYASYRAAWRALGRPEIEREETEMSDGQLRMRMRAWEREQAWGPRFVGNELAGTHQAATTHRQTAALHTAEADAATDPVRRADLERAAAEAAALADTLDARTAELQNLDDARAAFLAHTAGTRAAADRAKAEFSIRHIDDADAEPDVTAEEWLAAHRTATIEDDQHRDITPDDLVDMNADDRGFVEEVIETDAPDIREVVTAEPRQRGEDAVRVPTATETSDSIERAQRSLAEIAARDVTDAHEVEQQRADELTRWHAVDQAAVEESTAEDEAVDNYTAAREPADSP